MSNSVSTKGLCPECEKRNVCKKLCKEAEKYVNQDMMKQRELPSECEFLNSKEAGSAWDWVDNETYLTESERAIVTLLGKGLSRADVCKVLNMNRNSLRQALDRVHRKHLNP